MMYSAVLEAVVEAAKAATTMPVFKGAMPQPESVCIEIASGSPKATALNRQTYESIRMVVNAKSADMTIARTALDSIHRALTRAAEYTNNTDLQIVAIQTISAPSCIGRDAKDWLFGSSIDVQVYFK